MTILSCPHTVPTPSPHRPTLVSSATSEWRKAPILCRISKVRCWMGGGRPGGPAAAAALPLRRPPLRPSRGLGEERPLRMREVWGSVREVWGERCGAGEAGVGMYGGGPLG